MEGGGGHPGRYRRSSPGTKGNHQRSAGGQVVNKTSLSFPLATLPQVRREIAGQLVRIRNARWWFLLAVLLLSAGSFATVTVPQMLGRIVDLVAQNQPVEKLWETGVVLLGVAVAGGVLSASGFYLVVRMSERVIANLREDMVGTALGLPTHQVEDAGTGDLVSRSTDDIAELSSAVTETIPILTSSFFTIMATTIALFTLDWQFLFIPLLVAPVYYFAARHYLGKAPDRYARERAAMAERARRLLEAIRGRATVRAYSMEDEMHTQIKNSSWTVVTRGIRARTTMLILS
ncbi:MAG: ABC transporter ATP-binding protein, partial [Corynebacterium sp.]|nr:ABC transporter ATP-binding protein [Corynebacterium sp.]